MDIRKKLGRILCAASLLAFAAGCASEPEVDSFAAAQESLSLMIEDANTQTPITYGNGMVLDEISVVGGNEVISNFILPDGVTVAPSEDIRLEVENALRDEMVAAYADMGETQTFRDAEAILSFYFYTQGMDLAYSLTLYNGEY